ncbi:MAG: OsmC family protein [Gammaproteobacteria bacterium]|nr:OsmC family protein [Gammaproteobacteria bacterium]
MSESSAFTVTLEHLQGYEFKVKFDWENVPDVVLDEPEPLGVRRGPNASRVLAAAVANCLSASLLFCLRKARVEPQGMRTQVTGNLTRNENGRLRIAGLDVRIMLDTGPQPAARLARCAEIFEDFCVVTESVRHGIPVQVEVLDPGGARLHKS